MIRILSVLFVLTMLASSVVVMTSAGETEPPRYVPDDTGDTVSGNNDFDIAFYDL